MQQKKSTGGSGCSNSISLLFVSTSEKSLAFVPSVHWACYRGSRSRRTALQPSWVSRSIGFARRNCAALKRRWSGAGVFKPSWMYLPCLVGGLEHLDDFPNSWDDDHMIQSDELIFFRGVGQPPTRSVCVCNFRSSQMGVYPTRILWWGWFMMVQYMLLVYQLNTVVKHQLADNMGTGQ